MKTFSRYDIFIIAVLSFIQFTVILDFMVIAPLGAMLLNTLGVTPAQFGWVVSAYAFSAGVSGLLAAGFADRYDRKHLLLFFYTGFLLGTLMCAVAPDYSLLLVARIVTGMFGGVIASVSLAIVTDLFPYELRSRVMGFVQMSFAVSQVAGIPVGIYLANAFGWHAPFWLILAVGACAGLVIARTMRPINGHLIRGAAATRTPLVHLGKIIAHGRYRLAFITTAVLAIGAFLMMPFSTAFLVNNIAISQAQLPLVFLLTGVSTMVILPVVGKISDSWGKFRVFTIGTILASIMVIVFTHLSISPLWQIILVNIVLFAGLMSRIVPATAMMTAVPEADDRGAFMSITSSLQQISGGVASIVAGAIIIQQTSHGPLEHYDLLGYACVASMILCAVLLYNIHKHVEGGDRLHPRVPTATPARSAPDRRSHDRDGVPSV
jgi:predicted MFS family arabinose efflux permease